MVFEVTTELLAFTFLVLLNIIALAVFASNIQTRVKSVEESIIVLFNNDKLHDDDLKTLKKIEGQLELLISYMMDKK